MAELQQIMDDRSIEDALAAKLGGDKPQEPKQKHRSMEGLDDDVEQRKTFEKDPDAGETEGNAEGAESEPDAEPEVPEEEFEFDGKLYKAPKELKEAVLRHKDYTEKTMALAEERKLAQQEREFIQTQAAFTNKYAEHVAEVKAIESRLKQFDQLDWTQLAEANQAQYLALDRQERQLRDQYQRKIQEVQAVAAEFQREAQTHKEKKLVAGREILRKEFRDQGEDFGQKLFKTGETFGFTKEELEMVDDPRMVRVLNAARQWTELQSAKPGVQKRAEQAKPVKVTNARSAQSNQSTAQIEQLRTRVQKTGDSRAAEDMLTRLLSRKK